MGVRGQRHVSPLYPRDRPGTHCIEVGWVPGSVSTGVGNLDPTGIRSPDRPVRSESLYRLSYPGSLVLDLAYLKVLGKNFITKFFTLKLKLKPNTYTAS